MSAASECLAPRESQNYFSICISIAVLAGIALCLPLAAMKRQQQEQKSCEEKKEKKQKVNSEEKEQHRIYLAKPTRQSSKKACALQDLEDFHGMLSSIQQSQSGTASPADQQALQSYLLWCKKCPVHWNTIATALGFAGEHPSQVLTWLTYLRQQSKPAPQTLLGKLSHLRAALHYLAQQGTCLPLWAQRGAEIDPPKSPT